MARLLPGLVAFLALGAVLLVPGVARSCSCAGWISEDEAFQSSRAVVIGRTVRVDVPWVQRSFVHSGLPDRLLLVAVGLNRNSIQTQVAVDETLKGAPGDLISVTSPIALCCDCTRGHWSRPGERHMLFLRGGRGDRFTAWSVCQRLEGTVPPEWTAPPTTIDHQVRFEGPLPDDLPSLVWQLLLTGLLLTPGWVAYRRGAPPSTLLNLTLVTTFTPLLGVGMAALALPLSPPTPPPYGPSTPDLGPDYWPPLFWGKELLVAGSLALGGLSFWRPLRGASPQLALLAGLFIAGGAVLNAQNALTVAWVLDGPWAPSNGDALRAGSAIADARGRGVWAMLAATLLGGGASFYAARRGGGRGVRFPLAARIALCALLVLSAAAVRSWERQLRQPAFGGHELTTPPRSGDSLAPRPPFPVFHRPVAVIEGHLYTPPPAQAEQGALGLPVPVSD